MRREMAFGINTCEYALQSGVQWRHKLAAMGLCAVELNDDTAFLQLADSLGRRVPSWRGGSTIDRLAVVHSVDAPRNSFSFIFGDGGFPFHTDMARTIRPPRYVIMRLASSSVDVRPTLLIDFQQLVLSFDARTALESEIWMVKSRPSFPSSVVTNVSESLQFLRYDPVCMIPATRRASIAGRDFEKALAATNPIPYHWRPTHALVMDNWRILHARSADRVAQDNSRILERVQVSVEG